MECLNVGLESDIIFRFYDQSDERRLKELRREDSLKKKIENKKVETIVVSLRNLSETEAHKVSVLLIISGEEEMQVAGPEIVPGYGLADFAFDTSLLSRPVRIKDLMDIRADVDCKNCKTIKRKK